MCKRVDFSPCELLGVIVSQLGSLASWVISIGLIWSLEFPKVWRALFVRKHCELVAELEKGQPLIPKLSV